MIKLINKFKRICLKSNRLLLSKKLTLQNFGNVSQRVNSKNFVIKPSGVDLKKTKINDIVLVNIENGKKINSKFNPSTDTETHRILYKTF